MNGRQREDSLDLREKEARSSAIKQVALLLQRPDQLEKVEQLKKRYSRKKAAADALLKSAIQSQLDGVKTGLSQLGSCLEDIKVVKTNLSEIHTIYESISGLKDKLNELSRESSKHHQLASAVESLKHVANVPELVRQTAEYISDGKLLYAHRNLADLEASRDQLLLELHKEKNKSDEDSQKIEIESKMLQGYFQEVQKLSESMAKQLWLILSRTLITVRKKPAEIVTVLRIIERECRADDEWKRRFEQTGYMPADRPKRWREKALNVLTDAVEHKLEGCQLEERSQHKMWLVRHLEIIRRNTIDDLKVVKNLCEPCFPPVYDIVRTYVKMHHTAISQHLLHVISSGLEGNEIINLLNWITTYYSEEFMGHKGLQIQEGDLGPLLASDVVEELQRTYLHTLRNNVMEWMSNSISSDKKDWFSTTEPDTDGKGYYFTQLPVLLFQIIEQNMQVAQLLGADIIPKVLSLILDELSLFANSYSAELSKFKESHVKDRLQPRYYVQYLIANVNNCNTLSDLTIQLRTKYTEGVSYERLYGSADRDRYNSIANQFIQVSNEGCLYLKEEVFLDIQQFISNILGRPWLDNGNDVDTICITLEDYHHDFLHLRPSHFNQLMLTIYEQIVISYLRQLLSPSKKVTFKGADDRRDAAEKVVLESKQIVKTLKQLSPDVEVAQEYQNVLPDLAEILKMADTSMMSLELSTVVTKYPDVRADLLVNLLLLRGDTNRSDAQQFVNDSLTDRGNNTAVRKGVFSKV